MQRNWRTEYFKNLIKDKTRTKRWRKVLLCLSCVVVFWTVYALILPAITLESKKCNIEEHTHSAELFRESGTDLREGRTCPYSGVYVDK